MDSSLLVYYVLAVISAFGLGFLTRSLWQPDSADADRRATGQGFSDRRADRDPDDWQRIFRKDDKGSVFTVLMVGIGMAATLSIAAYQLLTGPIASVSRVTQHNLAKNQMITINRIALMDAVLQPSSGDCDSDGYVEPRAWRATTGQKPTNGGLLPLAMGAPTSDPWMSDYGYCVWDVGTLSAQAGCGGATGRLDGADNPVAGNAKTLTVMAVISAGPDRVFQTTCNAYVDATTDLIATTAGSDDLVQRYTYAEAAAGGGGEGLWFLKSGDPSTATISKGIEVGGSGLVQATAVNTTGKIIAGGGLQFGTQANVTGCGVATNVGVQRYNTTTSAMEICNGTAWTQLTVASPMASLTVSPVSIFNWAISGPCSGGDCPWAYEAWRAITVSNPGGVATSTLSVPTITGANSGNFEIDAGISTCDDGIALAPAGSPGNSCVIQIRARANGNGSFSAQVNLLAGALSATVPLYGVATGFGCTAGGRGWGGVLTANCTGSGGIEPGTGQIILQDAGCGCGTFEPACSGTPSSDCNLALFPTIEAALTDTAGNQNTVNLLSYGASTPAAQYCFDLVKDGYSDWFLPSSTELSAIVTDSLPSTVFTGDNHNSSNMASAGIVQVNGTTGSTTTSSAASSRRTRCIRRHNTALPATAQADTNPAYISGSSAISTVSLTPTYTSSTSTRTTSASFQVIGINEAVSFNLSGAGSPAIRVNGGPEITSGTISPRDSVAMVATSPSSAGNQGTASLQIGTDESPVSWTIRIPTAGKTVKMFITPTTTNGSFGGIAGGDSICQSAATTAGLSSASTYRALLASTSIAASSRIAWDASRFETVAGALVGNNLSDLSDGSIVTAIPTPSGTLPTGSIWTGITTTNLDDTPASANSACTNWTGTAATNAASAVVGATNGSWINASNGSDCTITRHLYCYGPN